MTHIKRVKYLDEEANGYVVNLIDLNQNPEYVQGMLLYSELLGFGSGDYEVNIYQLLDDNVVGSALNMRFYTLESAVDFFNKACTVVENYPIIYTDWWVFNEHPFSVCLKRMN